MLIGEMADHLNTSVIGNPNVRITGIQYDSRKVEPGNLFVCISGLKQDGHDFIPQALKKGAGALMVQRRIKTIDLKVPQIVVTDTRRSLADLSSLWYNFPDKQLRVVGVTGTNGKTTTTHLIKGLLETQGSAVGLIGTIHNMVGGDILTASHTTPESLELNMLLSEMVKMKSKAVVMEVSSHALKQHRVASCEFDIAVFTNLTQDHLDYHSSWEDYLNSKQMLFSNLHLGKKDGPKYAVINADDKMAPEFIRTAKVPVWTYGIKEQAVVKADDIKISARQTEFNIRCTQGKYHIKAPLIGMFNVYNLLAAITVALAEGITLPTIADFISSAPQVPGRFELIDMGQPFAVIVDYAHTPDGLKNILATAREITQGRVITVFGCGGDRDRGKRPMMGEISGKYSDFTIITSDNPRSENPDEIIAEIEQGMRKISPKYLIIEERRKAIQEAILKADPGDIVVIAGKGHETYQLVKGETLHFDDREEARDALNKLGMCYKK
ncbi:MAG: UDP-N-acetylmuramoyl-L-alanyl-D-glutamate--2,6-diaminopimelate ligase [Bacillota bacterium]|jgi:UDP-N-acetylmuramoyl-L-alanyl-D-glutamate--2,6-diaminopimelate ligase